MVVSSEQERALEAGSIAAAVDASFACHPDKTGQLLNVLNDIQETYRYLPDEAISLIAARLGIESGQIVRMGEFFGSLSLDPVGRCIIDVCDGTACHTQGASRLVAEFEKALGIKAGETRDDLSVTLRTVGCVGACGMAPVVVVDEEAYGRVRVAQVSALADLSQRKAADAGATGAAAGAQTEAAAGAETEAATGAATESAAAAAAGAAVGGGDAS